MKSADIFIVCICAAYLCCLAAERLLLAYRRKRIRHVIHVNGTRGKSTVTRMIDAGLRAGGHLVFSKTTGTVPQYIGVDGTIHTIRRFAPATIHEQLRILALASRQNAGVLVVECMAITPEMQAISQHKMLRADIGVITNVRLDHLDVMGKTLDDICGALTNTIPRGGTLFTADTDCFGRMQACARFVQCEAVLVDESQCIDDFDFAPNTALALAVCERLGVARSVAEDGIRRYAADPYAKREYTWGTNRIANSFSANDPQSTAQAYAEAVRKHPGLAVALVVNSRKDRAFRTRQMVDFAKSVLPAPYEIILLGSQGGYMRRKLKKDMPHIPLRLCKSANDIPFDAYAGTLFFLAGNIHGEGFGLIERIRSHAS